MSKPRVEAHFIDHLSCGHTVDCYAFVGEPEDIIATKMEFAWAVPCHQCPRVTQPGFPEKVDTLWVTAVVTRESFEFVGYEEINA